MPKTSIKDIAARLGVSNALVSFVLNGKSKEKRISKEMTKRVLEMAKELNYKPNYLAKSLRTGKSHTIALIIADISNPFFAKIARHIEIEASRLNYKVIFANSDEKKDRFKVEFEVLKGRQVDGFILIPPIGSEDVLREMRKEKIPFVVVDRYFNDVDAPSINIDNYSAGYHATARLLKNGRKKVAIVNVNNQLLTMRERVKGYRKALRDHGVKVDPGLVKQLQFSHDKNKVHKAVEEILEKGADGVLFTTSKLAILGLESLREMNVIVPEQLSVISFDDMDAYKIAFTRISAVIQPIEKMSQQAVQMLVDLIDGKKKFKDVENLNLEVDFVYRESCP